MRHWITITLIAAFLAPAGARAAESGDPAPGRAAVRAVSREDGALRRQPAKLRFRHHIEHLDRRWRWARRRAGEGPWAARAREGEVGALELLAHWSGLESDHRVARKARSALAASRRTGSEPAHDLEPRGVAAPVQTRRTVPPAAGADLTPFPVPAPALRTPPAPSEWPIRTVILDPGHGGSEEGAHGPNGLLEKDVNLAIARGVRARLEGHLQVIMTRDGDREISLAERARIANRAEADLFVSIHANAHRQTRFHGIETYILDVEGRRYGSRLEDREAAEGELARPDRDPALRQDLRLLLADRAMRAATERARQLALRVQREVVSEVKTVRPEVVDLGVKSALFYVLLGARMPSILVETGFLTHPREGRELADPAYRRRIADAIAQAVLDEAGLGSGAPLALAAATPR